MRIVDLGHCGSPEMKEGVQNRAWEAFRSRALHDSRVRGFVALEENRFLGAAAVEPRAWDTAFFGRRMGGLTVLSPASPEAGQRLVEAVVESAREDGYLHLMSRLRVVDDPYAEAATLERSAFSLLDVGTTLVRGRHEPWAGKETQEVPGRRIRPMREGDLSSVVSFGGTLFKQSYFYRDPFIRPGEADRLHRTWIENLFRRDADVVWVCEVEEEPVGFVTCRVEGAEGVIALVGVDPSVQRRGIASAVLKAAVHWFLDAGVESIRVKTQSSNVPALNLYLENGFRFGFVDLTFCRSL